MSDTNKTEGNKTNQDDSNHVNDFLLTTTAHGFYKVGVSTKRPIRRVIWLIVIVATMIGCSVHLSFVISRYLSYPMVSKQYQETRLAVFPDITICPNSPISAALVQNKVPTLGNKIFDQLSKDIYRFWSCVVANRIALKNSKVNRKILIERFVQSTLFSYALEANVTQDIMAAMLICDKGKVSCNRTRDFEPYFDTMKWSCQTYKSRVQSQDSIRGTELEITLFQPAVNWQYDIETEATLSDTIKGATVIIHAPGTMAIGSEHEVNIGNEIVISVRMTNFTEEINPKNLCHNRDDMITVVEKDEPVNYVYSSAACEKLALQNQIRTECGCFSEDLPVPYDPQMLYKNTPRCHSMPPSIIKDIFQLDCNQSSSLDNLCYISLSKYPIFETMFSLVRCHEKVVSSWKSFPVECEARCKREEYHSFSKYENRAFRSGDNRILILSELEKKKLELAANGLSTKLIDDKISQAKSNNRRFMRGKEFPTEFQKIRVDLTSVMGNKVEENLAYPIGTLFSDIGGVLGLWVGCSIITILEISELSINIANKAADKTRKHIKFGTLARTAMLRSRAATRRPFDLNKVVPPPPSKLDHVEESPT